MAASRRRSPPAASAIPKTSTGQRCDECHTGARVLATPRDDSARMTVMGRWVVVAAAAVCAVLASNCSIEHKSAEYTCEVQSDCEGGRTCSGGFCLVAQDASTKGAC